MRKLKLKKQLNKILSLNFQKVLVDFLKMELGIL